jgi:hypothetical protein
MNFNKKLFCIVIISALSSDSFARRDVGVSTRDQECCVNEQEEKQARRIKKQEEKQARRTQKQAAHDSMKQQLDRIEEQQAHVAAAAARIEHQQAHVKTKLDLLDQLLIKYKMIPAPKK